MASVQDVTGSPGDLWDTEDDTRVALRHEVETLQGQVERLTAEVRLGSAIKEFHSITVPKELTITRSSQSAESRAYYSQGNNYKHAGFCVKRSRQGWPRGTSNFYDRFFDFIISIELPWISTAPGSKGKASGTTTIRTRQIEVFES